MVSLRKEKIDNVENEMEKGKDKGRNVSENEKERRDLIIDRNGEPRKR